MVYDVKKNVVLIFFLNAIFVTNLKSVIYEICSQV